jgi:hypothetical protein
MNNIAMRGRALPPMCNRCVCVTPLAGARLSGLLMDLVGLAGGVVASERLDDVLGDPALSMSRRRRDHDDADQRSNVLLHSLTSFLFACEFVFACEEECRITFRGQSSLSVLMQFFRNELRTVLAAAAQKSPGP